MEMQGAVEGGNTFADARFVDWCLEAINGNVVFAGPRVIEETVDGGDVFVDAQVIDGSGEVVDGNERAKG